MRVQQWKTSLRLCSRRFQTSKGILFSPSPAFQEPGHLTESAKKVHAEIKRSQSRCTNVTTTPDMGQLAPRSAAYTTAQVHLDPQFKLTSQFTIGLGNCTSLSRLLIISKPTHLYELGMNSRSSLIHRVGKRITISCRCSSHSHFVSQVFSDAALPKLHQSAAVVLMWVRLKQQHAVGLRNSLV